MTTRLLVVRHGQSTWNASGRLQGATAAVPLTGRGHREARAVARRLAGTRVAAVWSSDLLRCRQTAEPIAARHGLPVRTSALLREQAHGDWEGGSFALHEPAILAAGPDWAPPGGETARQVHERAGRFLDGLDRVTGDAAVVVVSHGETIRALLAAAAGRPVEGIGCAIVGGGEIVEVALRPAAARAR